MDGAPGSWVIFTWEGTTRSYEEAEKSLGWYHRYRREDTTLPSLQEALYSTRALAEEIWSISHGSCDHTLLAWDMESRRSLPLSRSSRHQCFHIALHRYGTHDHHAWLREPVPRWGSGRGGVEIYRISPSIYMQIGSFFSSLLKASYSRYSRRVFMYVWLKSKLSRSFVFLPFFHIVCEIICLSIIPIVRKTGTQSSGKNTSRRSYEIVSRLDVYTMPTSFMDRVELGRRQALVSSRRHWTVSSPKMGIHVICVRTVEPSTMRRCSIS